MQSRSTALSLENFDQAFIALKPESASTTCGLIQLAQGLVSEFWIVQSESGQTLGRVGANRSALLQEIGFIGFFECSLAHPEVARVLLQEAKKWLKQQGAQTILGPVDLSTWFNYRFLQEERTVGRSTPSVFSWEPQHPSQYVEIWKQNGFREFHSYHTIGFEAPAGQYPPGVGGAKRAYEAALGLGFRFRDIRTDQLIEKEIPILHRITLEAFSGALLFEPLPLSDFTQLYVQGIQGLDYSISKIVETPQGEAIGFAFGFMDQGHLILKTIAVLPEYQGKRLSSALTYPLMDDAVKRYQPTGFVSALVKSEATSEHLEKSHQREGAESWQHHYSLFSWVCDSKEGAQL